MFVEMLLQVGRTVEPFPAVAVLLRWHKLERTRLVVAFHMIVPSLGILIEPKVGAVNRTCLGRFIGVLLIRLACMLATQHCTGVGSAAT